MESPEVNIDLDKYRNIAYRTREHCLICGEKSADPVIDLPEFPLTEIYVDRRIDERLGYAHQAFQFCGHCGHGQLKNVIDPDLQYGAGSDYYFRSSQSVSGRETVSHFTRFMEDVAGKRAFRTIVEIGCNDLYLLKSIKSRAGRLIGIDPMLKGREEQLAEDNVFAVGDFFENVGLEPDADVVICKDTLEHVEDPKHLVRNVVENTGSDTIFFFQLPLLDTLVGDCRFDQVFHQHLNYFSLRSILHMLDEMECRLLRYSINYDHWAAIQIAFQKGADNSSYRSAQWELTRETVVERYSLFRSDMEQTNKRLHVMQNGVRYGYGAALMLPVLSYHLENDLSCLKCIIDDNADKDGLYYINLPVPIVHSSKIHDLDRSTVLVTSTASKMNTKHILEKLFDLNPRYIIYPLRTI